MKAIASLVSRVKKQKSGGMSSLERESTGRASLDSRAARSSSGVFFKAQDDFRLAKEFVEAASKDMQQHLADDAIDAYSKALKQLRLVREALSLVPTAQAAGSAPDADTDGTAAQDPAGPSQPSALSRSASATRSSGGGTVTLQEVEDLEKEVYLQRSHAFSSLCREYLARPAARSERSALFGLDPGHLAALALADAQKAVKASPDLPEAHLRLGTALYLSERYGDAQAAYLAGLALEPTHTELQAGLKEVSRELQTDTEDEEAPANTNTHNTETTQSTGGQTTEGTVGGTQAGEGGSRGAAAAAANKKRPRGTLSLPSVDDCECILCMKLLYEPVTTPCGHTFCRTCFSRAMDHRNKCPVCRTVLHIGRELPVTVTLANILTKTYPEEYAERGAEEARLRLAAGAASGAGTGTEDILPSLPLFVMSTVFPGERMALNIFEPRYRLLVRRAMEGNRRMGMAQTQPGTHQLEQVAVEAELVECVPQPDGRYHIELVGRRRVEILSTSELDGYRVARARVFTDTPTEPESEETRTLPDLAHEVSEKMDTLVTRLRTWASSPAGRSMRAARVREVLERAGPQPPEDKYEALSLWAGSLLVTFSPSLDYSDRTTLLNMKSTAERLRFVRDNLASMPLMAAGGGAGPDGCSVM